MADEQLTASPPAAARLGPAALRHVLESHHAWLHGLPGGLRACLQGIALAEATLDHVNLERASLRSANLIDAHMSGVNLSGAELQWPT
jgi:uncharacterized protein YjbI with pentapeptide repeats